jgi:hypothetical protein
MFTTVNGCEEQQDWVAGKANAVRRLRETPAPAAGRGILAKSPWAVPKITDSSAPAEL